MKQKEGKGKIVIERKDGYESWNDERKIDGCALFTIKGNTIKGKGKRGGILRWQCGGCTGALRGIDKQK